MHKAHSTIIASVISVAILLLSQSLAAQQTQTETRHNCAEWLKHSFKGLHSSKQWDLCQLTAGKTVVIVNTASECGFTGQFKGLESLYQTYKDQGLVVIGFPSPDFNQEHDDEAKTAEVCYKNFGVSFPMMASTSIKGQQANPIFKRLGQAKGAPKWNFLGLAPTFSKK